MKKITFIIISTFIFISCNSLIKKNLTSNNYISYYSEIYQIDSLMKSNNKAIAFEKLDNLFKLYKPLNQRDYREMELYLKLSVEKNKKIKQKQIIKSLILEWGLNKQYIERDSLLNVIVKSNFDENQINTLCDEYNKKLNTTYKSELALMFQNDQKSRGKENEYLVDIENSGKLIKLIKKYGYPNKKNVGDLYKDRILLGVMLFHLSRTEQYLHLKKILYKNVRKGKASPEDLKMLIESRYLIFYKYDYFGDQETYRTNYKISKDTLNNRRLKIGLPLIH